MPAAALEVAGLRAGYGQTVIVDGVSFAVPAGQRVAVLGRNGVGKTTLLATIAGQTRRLDGRILVGGDAIEALSRSDRAGRGLGYVPQTRDVFASLTVEENLVAGLKDRPRDDIDEAYQLFPRLRERRRNLGGQLSGGEQQMLTTARTLLGRPSVLLLDEPLEGLAPIICDELMAVFTRLAESRAMTVLLVEQRLRAALDFAERVLIFERGQLAWDGNPDDLERQPEVVERLLSVGR